MKKSWRRSYVLRSSGRELSSGWRDNLSALFLTSAKKLPPEYNGYLVARFYAIPTILLGGNSDELPERGGDCSISRHLCY